MMAADEETVAGALRELQEVNALVRRGEFERADALLASVSTILPGEPETLRLRGLLHHLRGRLDEALAELRAAHQRWPDNAAILNNLGGVLRDAGDSHGAIAALRKACEIDPQGAAGWYNLGVVLASLGRTDEAAATFARALECNPEHVAAQLAHADMLARQGRPAQAAAQYRATLLREPVLARAWIGLAHVAAASLSDAELEAFRRLAGRPELGENDRAAATFALGHVLDARGDFDAALAAFEAANAIRRRQLSWNGAEFSQRIDAAIDAYVDISIGHGASELANVIQEESNRREEAFPGWVAKATPQDWQRMGRRYLERSARWRRPDAIHVDAALPNWPFLGAAFAMLPGIRVINARGDALETTWACYRRGFARASEAYSYDYADLARHWQDHERTMLFWHARHAQRIYQQDATNLLADPAAALRDLLAFCNLPFDKQCAKAAAAIAPAATARAYGNRLDPLRRQLDPFARDLR